MSSEPIRVQVVTSSKNGRRMVRLDPDANSDGWVYLTPTEAETLARDLAAASASVLTRGEP
jgi:hypothetical protein